VCNDASEKQACSYAIEKGRVESQAAIVGDSSPFLIDANFGE
jgi:hypothetical protein